MAVVDFIYKGEVSVEDHQLASFLTTAELLEVQGLTNHQESVDPNKVVIEVSNKLNIEGVSQYTHFIHFSRKVLIITVNI
jgi:hypothetical protein